MILMKLAHHLWYWNICHLETYSASCRNTSMKKICVCVGWCPKCNSIAFYYRPAGKNAEWVVQQEHFFCFAIDVSSNQLYVNIVINIVIVLMPRWPELWSSWPIQSLFTETLLPGTASVSILPNTLLFTAAWSTLLVLTLVSTRSLFLCNYRMAQTT